MTEQPQKKLSPAEAIYRQVQQANQGVQKLEPLLQLVETPEGEASPIEELQKILEAILHGQRLLAQRVEDLHDKIDAQSTRRA